MIRRAAPLIGATIAFGIAGYIIQVGLARGLGPTDYGLVTAAMSVLALANVVQAAGPPQVIARRTAQLWPAAGGVLRSGLALQTAVSAALGAALVASAFALSLVFGDPLFLPVLLVGTLMVPPVGVLTAFSGYWNGAQRFGRSAMGTVAYAAAKVVLILPLAYIFGPLGAMAGYAMAPVCGVLVVMLKPPASPSEPLRHLASLTVPFVAIAVLTLAIYSVDVLLLKALAGDPATVGHYSAAAAIASLPVLGGSAFNQVLLSRVASALGKDDRAGARAAAEQSVRQLLILLVPGSAVISATAPELTVLLFGTGYQDSGPPLRILVIAMCVVAMLGHLAAGLAGSGHAGDAVRASMIGLTTTVLAAIVVIPGAQAVGAATAVLVGGSLGAFAAGYSAHRRLGFRVRLGRLVRVFAGGSIAFAVGSVDISGPSVVLQCVIAAALGALTILILGESTAAERARVRQALRRSSDGTGDGSTAR